MVPNLTLIEVRFQPDVVVPTVNLFCFTGQEVCRVAAQGAQGELAQGGC